MQNESHYVGSEEFITPKVAKHVESVARRMVGASSLDTFAFEDVCQELYEQILSAAESYDPSKCSVYTYACRIVDRYKNRILRDRMRSASDRREYEKMVVPEDFIDNSTERAILVNDVRQIISELPPEYRVFCECLLDGKSMRVAAQIAGFTWGSEMQNTVLPFLREKFGSVFFS